MKVLITISLLMIPWVALADTSSDPEAFVQANQAYEQGDYAKAIPLYSLILSRGTESSEIHFNMGNAYFRSNQLGQAIFHFRKAAQLAPRDPDIQYNLSFAREKVADHIEAAPSFQASFFSFLDLWTVKEQYLFVLFLGLVSFFAGCLSLSLKNGRTRWGKNIIFAALILALFFLWLREQTFTEFGVVVAPEVSVYSGFERDRVVLFQLHEGVEFNWNDKGEKTWVQINLADGKKGWVPIEGVVF
jgi:tetratricopeptide (TPR) repeat protein